MTKTHILFHPLFILSLLILLLNDFFLKQAYPNQFTGKLSDFAGLVVFPMFVAGIYPRSVLCISGITGLLFIVWKTPVVSPVIELFNQISHLQVQRVCDYSDYWALIVLPIVHRLIKKDHFIHHRDNLLLPLVKGFLTTVTVFAICATSIPHPLEMPQGTVYIGTTFTIKKSKEETISIIRSLGYNVDYYENSADSTIPGAYRTPYYQTDNIVLYDKHSMPVDTVVNVKYRVYETGKKKTNIQIINVTLSEKGNIQRWQTLKRLKKQYRKLLKHQLIEKIK